MFSVCLSFARLPYDLVLPLARFVARDDSITRLKRWNISPVYREDRMGGVSAVTLG